MLLLERAGGKRGGPRFYCCYLNQHVVFSTVKSMTGGQGDRRENTCECCSLSQIHTWTLTKRERESEFENNIYNRVYTEKKMKVESKANVENTRAREW